MHLSSVLLIPAMFLGQAMAAELARDTLFASSADFVTALRAYDPSTSKSDVGAMFRIEEPGEIPEGATRPTRTASSIASCEQLWGNEQAALLYATARPSTEATPSEVGLLILITREGDRWRIADMQKFTALGKDARIAAELTAGTGAGSELGREGFAPVVTVQEFHGGRGYRYDLSASYTVRERKIVRQELRQ